MTPNAPASAVPTATYRLQLDRSFGFRDATALVPYLARLGISHVYCSPYLRARAGSTHGYDITDHSALNPEIGDEADFEAFVAALHAHEMGQILDFVPNHMGIGQADNAWWLDVLEYGATSPWASHFDIDWKPAKRELRGKVLLPFLGDHYGPVLERGELRLAFDAERGTFSIWYHEHRFPVTPRSVSRLLAARIGRLRERVGADHLQLPELARVLGELAGAPSRGVGARRGRRERAEQGKRDLAALVAAEPALRAWIEEAVTEHAGDPAVPDSFAPLHDLLEHQHYRIAFWRVASDEINYRRFFDINELAALRMERPDVFAQTHALVLEWIAAGKLAGLRIDHIDGLLDPRAYCECLREAGGADLYIVVEKILAHHESLRAEWPAQGTTGYEFMNAVAGLFVDPAGETALGRTWRRFAPGAPSLDDEIYASKKHVMNFLLAGELQVLANRLDRLSEARWSTRDFTMNSLREALKELVACFPVYRSYVDSRGASTEDRRDIDWAVAQARRRSSDPEPTLFDWLHRTLTNDVPRRQRRAALDFAMRLQQYTAPVMAKALEDTSFYRYHRLASLNEVGGDPRRFGTSPAAFHKANTDRARRWPHAMLATSTHDAKRGEDTRLRIHALSELATEWEAHVRRWVVWNRRFKRSVDGGQAPATDDEYLLYQTLIGSWPQADGARPASGEPWLAAYHERVRGYAIKALREGKRRSSWRHPKESYEEALLEFLGALLDPGRAGPFLGELASLVARVSRVAALHGLAQTLLKITAPGVPDFYQGTEFWDLALADPDNRRPVDFARREVLLAEMAAADPARVAEMLERWPDGRIKLWLASRLLPLRRRSPELLRDGEYLPLVVDGEHAVRAVAFVRRSGDAWLLALAPRLVTPLLGDDASLRIAPERWGDTTVRVPIPGVPQRWRDVLSGAAIEVGSDAAESSIRLSDALTTLPFAVLVGGETR